MSNISSSSSSSSILSSSQTINYEELIGYTFNNRSLLVQALTHPSIASEQIHAINNERLEFLGDSVLDLVIADILFTRLLDAPEGNLTKLKSSLVSTASVAQIGKRLRLPQGLIMSNGEVLIGGRDNDNNIENAMEALIGAIYIDAGYEKTKEIVSRIWEKDIQHTIDNGVTRSIDAKSIIERCTQKLKLKAPEYTEVRREGPDHRPTFTVSLAVTGYPEVIVKGSQLKKTKINAATEFLDRFPEIMDALQ